MYVLARNFEFKLDVLKELQSGTQQTDLEFCNLMFV